MVTWCTTSITFNNCTLCPHCIYVFCIYLSTNSGLCHLQHKLIGFYNRDLTVCSPVVTICTTSITFNNCTLCPHCIYVFCIYLRTNSDLCHLQHKLISFHNRDLTLYSPVVTICTINITFNNRTLCPHCIYVFCIYPRTNSDLCHLQHKLISFYNRDLTLYSPVVTICTTSITFNNSTLCPHCIYVFCIYLRTNSDLCHLQHKLIGFYNPDEKCLQRGTDWGFK